MDWWVPLAVEMAIGMWGVGMGPGRVGGGAGEV